MGSIIHRFLHRIGFRRIRTQRSGTQRSGTCTRNRVYGIEYEYHFIEYVYDKSQNSDFLAVGCGLNDCSCIASDFALLVHDGSRAQGTEAGFLSRPCLPNAR